MLKFLFFGNKGEIKVKVKKWSLFMPRQHTGRGDIAPSILDLGAT